MTKLTPKDLKRLYSMALSTQWLYRKDKRIPFEKVGNSVFYNGDQIQEMALEGELTPDAYQKAHEMRIKNEKTL